MTQWFTTLIFHVWDNTGCYLTFQKAECIWLSGSCLFGMFVNVTKLWLVLLQLFILIQNKIHTVVAGALEVRLFLCRKYWGEILALIGLHIIFPSMHVFQYTSVCTSRELWRKAFWREMMIYQNRRFVGINQVQLSIYSEGLQVQKEILSLRREYSWKHTTCTADSTIRGCWSVSWGCGFLFKLVPQKY